MTQRHFEQKGIFHVTTNAKQKIPWLTWKNVPETLIDKLHMTRNMQKAAIYAFCILPNHMHIIVRPGEKGLSAFMHSFKRNAMKDIRSFRSGRSRSSATERRTDIVQIMHKPPLRNGESPIVLEWQKGFHDERIESADQLENTLAYVRCNAWRHGLVEAPQDWPWSSIHFPFIVDPVEIW